MNRLRARALAALGLLAVLTGCAEEAPVTSPPTTGIVTSLEHVPAQSGVEVWCGYDYDGYGCEPEYWSEPECFLVEFEDAQGRRWEECAASAVVFNSLVVGAPYTEGQTAPYELAPTG